MIMNLIAHKRMVLFLAGTLFLFAACSPVADTESAYPRPTVSATKSPQAADFEDHETAPAYAAEIATQRDPRIPELPFADNPDPNQCGIPIQWGLDDPAWLNGIYDGEIIQPIVFLYDSHLRLGISGEAPHGSEVTIKLFQENPVTDYYMVEVIGSSKPVTGWIPAPLLSFEPVEPLS